MHELPITESILKIVLKHARSNGVRKVKTIVLRIGRLSDLEDEWIQKYFDYLSRGTLAAGARIAIERTPIVLQCNGCMSPFPLDRPQLDDAVCPCCGGTGFRLISGREYTIKEMEAF